MVWALPTQWVTLLPANMVDMSGEYAIRLGSSGPMQPHLHRVLSLGTRSDRWLSCGLGSRCGFAVVIAIVHLPSGLIYFGLAGNAFEVVSSRSGSLASPKREFGFISGRELATALLKLGGAFVQGLSNTSEEFAKEPVVMNLE